MNAFTTRTSWSVAVVWCLLSGVQAAEPPNPVLADDAKARWTLSTDDTSLTISVSGNKLYIDALENPSQDWNWVPVASEVPLPGQNSIRTVEAGVNTGNIDQTPHWTYAGVIDDKSDGNTVTLRFTSTNPALELKSVWRARPGPGPVENQVSVENKSGRQVVYSPEIAAGALRLRADKVVSLWSFEKTSVGLGHLDHDLIGTGMHLSKDSRDVPLFMLDAGSRHGAYIGYEWELGVFRIASGLDPLDLTVSVLPITEAVTQEANEVFTIPNVYYGTYKGDTDDGSNRFKKWFWNYKITRSLHDHADEPWTEVCMQTLGGNGSASVTGATPQSAYDTLAATGVECVKFDFWDGSGKCWYTDRDWTFHHDVWPNGFDYAAKAHKAGLKASLYMGGTYNDCDLTTAAGRDAELAAVLERYDRGWFDMWRSDFYTAPKEPMPQTYNGVSHFLSILDYLIANRPGFRYENCCNGGKYKGFAICQRMTFCTMNDKDNDAYFTRTTYYCDSYPINPVQLKSDLGPAETAYNLRTDMMGSILTWAVDNPIYRQHLALYKTRQRPILRGADVYHILPMPDGVNWDGLEYFNTGINKGSVFLFKPSTKAVDGDSKVIKLKGLERNKRYTLTFQDRTILNCSMTGQELMDAGITVTRMNGDNASEIIWIN
ncbi:MAG: GH36 C-terminal domain-containing protein [Limisphaerales bacterium]